MPTFADTAAYFEAKAGKARDDRRRADLAGTARFYRRLNEITPTFPFGYQTPAMNDAATRLVKRAEECRALAAAMRDPKCRARLLELAATYEQVARGPALKSQEAVHPVHAAKG